MDSMDEPTYFSLPHTFTMPVIRVYPVDGNPYDAEIQKDGDIKVVLKDNWIERRTVVNHEFEINGRFYTVWLQVNMIDGASMREPVPSVNKHAPDLLGDASIVLSVERSDEDREDDMELPCDGIVSYDAFCTTEDIDEYMKQYITFKEMNYRMYAVVNGIMKVNVWKEEYASYIEEASDFKNKITPKIDIEKLKQACSVIKCVIYSPNSVSIQSRSAWMAFIPNTGKFFCK